ncbi:MAG: hypothetical protein RBU29_09605, partial [bacterium]|nr:hypothetical protein [bacterium]
MQLCYNQELCSWIENLTKLSIHESPLGRRDANAGIEEQEAGRKPGFFRVAPGRAHRLGGEASSARLGELLMQRAGQTWKGN